MLRFIILLAAATLGIIGVVSASRLQGANVLGRRDGITMNLNPTENGTSTTVDLGYAIYEGALNRSTGVRVFKGIRYAAAPTSTLRWEPPHPPPQTNRSQIQSATEFAPICPQSFNAVPGNDFELGDEDCLFLNVYAPQDAVDLPVLVWIHGGGYGFFNGRQEMQDIINTNAGTFIGVSIQYRLGAFGFLSSDEVYRFGVPNAGLLDQNYALQWIQKYIGAFGGNPDEVTISGLSAGAGSVMLHDISYGGTLGTSLFKQSITASPYLPTQWNYNDFVPSQAYYAFAAAAGCPPTYAYGNTSQTIFACLQSQDTETLQRASNDISTSGTFGSWAFLPVTDGTFIQETPSQALAKKKVNGLRHLTANTAEEGPAYTPQTINTEDDLVNWIQHTFPLLTTSDIDRILHFYPASSDSIPNYPTAGDSGLPSTSTSQIASGHQQRANAILGETTFMCPSYWLALAYASSSHPSSFSHKSYKYQYSIPTALHGYDLEAVFGPRRENQGPDFLTAIQTSWGNFVRFGDPSISSAIAHGSPNFTDQPEEHEIESWPEFEAKNMWMANFNQTGGTPYEFLARQSVNEGPLTVVGEDMNVTLHGEPGLENWIRIVGGWGWEGGRGERCELWRSLGSLVPE